MQLARDAAYNERSPMNVMQTIAIWAIPVLLAITLHEVAHGWVARQYGDPTAAILGRLSLNPLRHIDPLGTVLVPIVLVVLVGFGFGWAKPVPVNFAQLRNPRRDMIWVAAAGPAANVVMALGWALVMKLGFLLLDQSQWVAAPLILAGQAGIVINLVLGLVNLIPIPPLDGGRILAGLAPARFLPAFEKVEPLGMLIVFGLLALGGLTFILHPLLQFFFSAIGWLFGIPV